MINIDKNIIPVSGDTITVENMMDVSSDESDKYPTLAVPEHIEAPLNWRFVRRKVTADPLLDLDGIIPRNEKLISASRPYHADSHTAHNMCELAYNDLVSWAQSLTDEGERLGEEDIIAKISMQYGVNPQWYFMEYHTSSLVPSKMWRQCADLVAQHWMYAYQRSSAVSRTMSTKDLMLLDVDKVESNCGYPSFSSDPLIRFATFMAAGLDHYPTVSELEAISLKWNKDLDIPNLSYPFALGRRYGPTRKATPMYDVVGDEAVPTHLVKGLWPNIRKVFFSSALINKSVSDGYIALRDAKYSIMGNYHSAEAKQKYDQHISDLMGQGYHMGESDFSRFDTSISVNHLNYAYDALIKVGFPKRPLEISRWIMNTASVLTPEWVSAGSTANGKTMAVYRGDIGLPSGVKDTNNIGSFFAQTVVSKALIEQGLYSISELQKSIPFMLNQSDDVLLITKRPIDPDKYSSSCLEDGIITKFFAGRRFLQKHKFPPNEFSVVARVIQQTLFNENETINNGQAALALAGRLYGGLTPQGEQFITDRLPFYVTGPFKTIISNLTGSANEWPKQLMRLPEVDNFINSQAGQHWLLEQYQMMDFKPSAASLIEFVGLDKIDPKSIDLAADIQLKMYNTLFGPKSKSDVDKALKILYYTIHSREPDVDTSQLTDPPDNSSSLSL